MLTKIGSHLRRNLVAYLALLAATSGTSYAAATKLLPANSVGTKQLINGSVQKIDLNKKTVTALRGKKGARGLRGLKGDKGDKGDPGANYSAGAGLALTGTVFSANFAGSGSANTVARSDHNHFGQSWAGAGPTGLSVQTTSTAGITSAGLTGIADNGYGVFGKNNTIPGAGVRGESSVNGAGGSFQSKGGHGVFGVSTDDYGGFFKGTNPGVGRGLRAESPGVTPNYGEIGLNNKGVSGFATSDGGVGVLGEADTGTAPYGVEGISSAALTGGLAGMFEGNVTVTGTLAKGAGSFKIDDPLDPAHKYLQHSFVESPDMMNVYNGNVTTDAHGFAVVTLPRYFQVLNRDFRYQLTPIGRHGWNARAGVWKTISGNRFTIRTDLAHVRVSWQVTGVRHDRFANAHRIPVESLKTGKERGRYLHPELYGKPASAAVYHR